MKVYIYLSECSCVMESHSEADQELTHLVKYVSNNASIYSGDRRPNEGTKSVKSS